MARGLGETTCLLSVCGEASNTRRCICELTRASVKPAAPLDAISTSTMASVPIRALTALRRTRLTSPSCPSAWQPNPGRGSTYRRGNSVQRIGTTANVAAVLRNQTIKTRPRNEVHDLGKQGSARVHDSAPDWKKIGKTYRAISKPSQIETKQNWP